MFLEACLSFAIQAPIPKSNITNQFKNTFANGLVDGCLISLVVSPIFVGILTIKAESDMSYHCGQVIVEDIPQILKFTTASTIAVGLLCNFWRDYQIRQLFRNDLRADQVIGKMIKNSILVGLSTVYSLVAWPGICGIYRSRQAELGNERIGYLVNQDLHSNGVIYLVGGTFVVSSLVLFYNDFKVQKQAQQEPKGQAKADEDLIEFQQT